MMSRGEVIVIDCTAPDPVAVDQAAKIIDEGGLVVAPTETRYGILARADKKQTIERVFQLKKRDQSLPMAMFFKDMQSVSEHAEVNGSAQALAETFLPGPMTLVLMAKGSADQPGVIDGKLGVRISSAPLMKSLTERVDFPISATSANLSGTKDHTDIAGVRADFADGIDMYLDGGHLDGELSTVVDCTTDDCAIKRLGAISQSEITRVLRGVN